MSGQTEQTEERSVITEREIENAKGVVKVSLKTYKGALYLDFRLWKKGRLGDQVFPSKEGFTLKPSQFPEFMKAMCDIGDELPNLAVKQKEESSSGQEPTDNGSV